MNGGIQKSIRTSKELIRTYHHPFTVTLDELPDLKG